MGVCLITHRNNFSFIIIIIITIIIKVKVKFTLEQATKAQRGRRGIAVLFH